MLIPRDMWFVLVTQCPSYHMSVTIHTKVYRTNLLYKLQQFLSRIYVTIRRAVTLTFCSRRERGTLVSVFANYIFAVNLY